MIEDNPAAAQEAPAPEASLAQEAPELSFSDTLKLLIELQTKDNALLSARGKIEELDKSLELIKEDISDKDKDFQLLKDDRKRILVDQKNVEMEVAKADADIAKNSASLQQVKTNDAYQVLLKEILVLKKKKDELETQILMTLEKIDQDKKREAEVSKELEAAKKNLAGEIVRVEGEKTKISAAVTEITSDLGAIRARVPEQALKSYDWLRTKRGGLALAVVLEGSSCGGCRMHLPQQIINDILKNREFISCERCQRILYIQK